MTIPKLYASASDLPHTGSELTLFRTIWGQYIFLDAASLCSIISWWVSWRSCPREVSAPVIWNDLLNAAMRPQCQNFMRNLEHSWWSISSQHDRKSPETYDTKATRAFTHGSSAACSGLLVPPISLPWAITTISGLTYVRASWLDGLDVLMLTDEQAPQQGTNPATHALAIQVRYRALDRGHRGDVGIKSEAVQSWSRFSFTTKNILQISIVLRELLNLLLSCSRNYRILSEAANCEWLPKLLRTPLLPAIKDYDALLKL